MRFYVFTPGQPGYISAEVAVRGLPTAFPAGRERGQTTAGSRPAEAVRTCRR